MPDNEARGSTQHGIEFEFQEGADESGSLIPAGTVINEIRSHLKKGEIDHAVAVYQSCATDLGEELLRDLKVESSGMVKAFEQMFAQARDFKRAARCAEKLGDFSKAARHAAQAGKHDDAAKLYASAGQQGDAAKAWLKAGNTAAAAEAYQASGELDLAAETHELGGDLLAAARALALSGQEAKAIPVLERIEPSHPQYHESRLMLGSVQARLGQLPEAARTFIGAIRTPPKPAPEISAEMLYLLGHVYSKMGDGPRARSAFEHVLKTTPGYKDAETLLAGLKDQPASPAPPPAAPTSPPGKPVEKGSGGHPVAKLEDFEHLKAMPLARDFSLDDLRLLHAQCETARFAAGAVIIKEGIAGEALFIVRSGSVQVKVGENVVATLGPGACVGEMALVDDGPTSATVVASGPVVTFRLSKSRFHRLLESRPGLALSVYRFFVETLVNRVRTANERLRGQ